MKAKYSKTITCLLFAGIVSSCSLILEDRTACPCWLEVTFRDPDQVRQSADVSGWRGTALFAERIGKEEAGRTWLKDVSKGPLVFSACEGMERCRLEDHYLTIPLGYQCDSVYAYREQVDATGDRVPVNVALHKQFATVFLDIHKEREEMRRYSFQVSGNSCGFDLLDFQPVPGSFRFRAKPENEDGQVSFRIPRQLDDGLRIDLERDSELCCRLPIGQYIRKTGYDWSSEDLEDIYLSVDLVEGRVQIGVAGWEQGEDFSIRIIRY